MSVPFGPPTRPPGRRGVAPHGCAGVEIALLMSIPFGLIRYLGCLLLWSVPFGLPLVIRIWSVLLVIKFL